LKRFGLDRLIWLVSPGNPLKADAPASLDRRIALCRTVATHPKIYVSRAEALMGTRYTAETLTALITRCPGVRFVWLMGADNLAQLHRWNDWTRIMDSVPVGVLARPGFRLAARNSVAARRYHAARLPDTASRLLPRQAPPCWCFVNMPMRPDASSAIRSRGEW
jgi:nicotinate-nucleotide adenylyltransferase